MKKYRDTIGTGLTRAQLQQIENIAMSKCHEICWRGGLDKRNNDSEDFPEVSIWGIQAMLEAVYKQGLEDGRKEKKSEPFMRIMV